MRSLNPNAKEFVPFAVHQFQINYPSLTSSPLIQPTPQKNNNLSFITAAKKKPKPCTKPKPPIILDPSWVVLSIADTADESLENEEQEEVPGIKTEEATPIIPHYILPVSEKPSIRAIDRWKAKWIQIARTVRENLERENMMRTSAQTNNIQNDKHNSWHQILSPGDYLPHMECIPSSTSDSNKNTSLLNNNDDCRAQNHNFSFTKDEWWSAIISGKVSNVLSMVNNSSPYFDWKTCSYTLTLSEPYNNCQEIKLGPLHVAVYYNQSACVKLFLDFGMTSSWLLLKTSRS